ncbi:hypothetical protein ACFL6C_04740 [Myxococcota bacterium]
MTEHPRLALFLEATIIFVCVCIHQTYLQFSSPHLPGTDGYYHIKLAWLIRTEGLPDSFPWAAFSLWNEHFFDKDFGFHLLLIPFTFGDLIFGAKLAAACYGAAVFTSFYLVLRLQGIRAPWFWTLLLVSAGGFFGWRVNVPRPQILSVTLSLWAVFFVLRKSWKGTAAVGCLYALSYAAPLLVVLYALIDWVAGIVCEGDWRRKALIGAVIGVSVGWIVHPHFPNNFHTLWVQLVHVLGAAWGTVAPDLSLADELKPTDTRSFLLAHLTVCLTLGAASLAMTRLRGGVDRALLVLFAIANGFFIMTCLSRRFVEYWVPFSLWLGALVLSRLLESMSEDPPVFWRNIRTRRIVLAVVLLMTAGLFVRSHLANRRAFARLRPSTVQAEAIWLANHSRQGDLVFTCDWDDAPELFYFNHHNRYLVFLDPTFMYAWRPEIWTAWNRISNGLERQPVATIQQIFGARYVYCAREFGALTRMLAVHPRVKLRFSGMGGAVFEILPETASGEPIPIGVPTHPARGSTD